MPICKDVEFFVINENYDWQANLGLFLRPTKGLDCREFSLLCERFRVPLRIGFAYLPSNGILLMHAELRALDVSVASGKPKNAASLTLRPGYGNNRTITNCPTSMLNDRVSLIARNKVVRLFAKEGKQYITGYYATPMLETLRVLCFFIAVPFFLYPLRIFSSLPTNHFLPNSAPGPQDSIVKVRLVQIKRDLDSQRHSFGDRENIRESMLANGSWPMSEVKLIPVEANCASATSLSLGSETRSVPVHVAHLKSWEETHTS